MSHVERCPVCQGVGKIYTGIYVSAYKSFELIT